MKTGQYLLTYVNCQSAFLSTLHASCRIRRNDAREGCAWFQLPTIFWGIQWRGLLCVDRTSLKSELVHWLLTHSKSRDVAINQTTDVSCLFVQHLTSQSSLWSLQVCVCGIGCKAKINTQNAKLDQLAAYYFIPLSRLALAQARLAIHLKHSRSVSKITKQHNDCHQIKTSKRLSRSKQLLNMRAPMHHTETHLQLEGAASDVNTC